MTILDLFRPRINVYLIDVNENPSQQNGFLPSTGTGQSQPVGLDLRYLVSFYGVGTIPQNLLQSSIKAMAAKPAFDPTGGTTPASNVHLVLERTDTWELEKVGSMMGVRHTPSMIYQATGLII